MSNDQGLFETFGVGEAIILITIWVIMAVLAYVVAPDDRRWQFVGLTLVLLGPLGVAAAAIAQPRDPDFYALPYRRAVAAGRQRFICPRCGAENDIRASAESYDCWRCSERRTLQPAKTVAKVTSAKAAAMHAGKNLASEIDAKLADFEAGRISLHELESYLNGLEGKRGPTGRLPLSNG
jgi:hypothetical protein